MPEAENDKLGKILELTEENNRILRSMNRRMIWGQIFSYLYWGVILGLTAWSYILLQPYMEKYWTMFQHLSTQMSGLESGTMTLPSNFGSLLEKLK